PAAGRAAGPGGIPPAATRPAAPRQELDEDAELRRAHQATADDLALAEPARYGRPRVAVEGFQAQRDPALLLVDLEHLHGHRLAETEAIPRSGNAAVRDLRDGHETLDATQIDEGAEVGERGDRPRQNSARDDLPARLLGVPGSALLEELTARQHDIPAICAVPGDPELEHAADVGLGRFRAPHVHLRKRAEGAKAGNRHLVAALDDGGDLALHGNPARRRRGQRLPGLGATLEAVREPDV